VTHVVFYVDGASFGTDTAAPWQATLSGLTPGSHTVVAVATDNSGASTASPPVNFTVKAATGPNAVADTFTVFSTGLAANLNVLANDTGSGPLRIVSVNRWANPYATLRSGSVGITHGGGSLTIRPARHSFGTNFVTYDVAD
jgi:hypothetical protein